MNKVSFFSSNCASSLNLHLHAQSCGECLRSLTNLVRSLPILQQRQEHKKREDGNTSALTDERLERLQSIEFIWAKRKGQIGWDEKYVSQRRFANLNLGEEKGSEPESLRDPLPLPL